jgi:murein DD-endopeptidase MepM/ murein hydrolase activator NlpD
VRWPALLCSLVLLALPGRSGVARTPAPPMVLDPPEVPVLAAALWPIVAEKLQDEGFADPGPAPDALDPDSLAAWLAGRGAWTEAGARAKRYRRRGDQVWPGFLLRGADQRRVERGWARVQALASALDIRWPLEGRARTTSRFGPRTRPLAGGYQHHDGVDLGVPVGTPVYAAQRGRVVWVGAALGPGRYVVIDHGSGVRTRYLHLDSTAVRFGQRVDRGERIGASGESGRVTGPHLHFEVMLDGAPLDPEILRP